MPDDENTARYLRGLHVNMAVLGSTDEVTHGSSGSLPDAPDTGRKACLRTSSDSTEAVCTSPFRCRFWDRSCETKSLPAPFFHGRQTKSKHKLSHHDIDMPMASVQCFPRVRRSLLRVRMAGKHDYRSSQHHCIYIDELARASEDSKFQ